MTYSSYWHLDQSQRLAKHRRREYKRTFRTRVSHDHTPKAKTSCPSCTRLAVTAAYNISPSQVLCTLNEMKGTYAEHESLHPMGTFACLSSV